MSKSSISTYAIIASSLLVPALAFAKDPDAKQVIDIAGNLIALARLLVTLVFVLALLVFVWGAVKLILAAGDPEQIKKAKSFMWWGVIAMAVLASVFGLITFLQTYLGVTGGGGFEKITIPNLGQ